jgi:hypothetical protein
VLDFETDICYIICELVCGRNARMIKYYEEPVVNIRKYSVVSNIFTSGPGEGDDFELDSIDPKDNADNFFADEGE